MGFARSALPLLWAGAASLLLVSACQDSPTAPPAADPVVSPPSGGPSDYMLPPIIVIACSSGYTKDELEDHCVPVAEEQTRDGDGGGTTDPGYGGGAGGDGEPPTDEDKTLASTSNDMVSDTINKSRLDCANPQSAQEAAICRSTPLTEGTTYRSR